MKNMILWLTCFVPGVVYASSALLPAEVVNACLKTESTNRVKYSDISPSIFSVEQDSDAQLESTVIIYRRERFGVWESSKNSSFGIQYNDYRIKLSEIVRIGNDGPISFTPYTAQWGVAKYGVKNFFCITFNFPGVGQSGTFQNIRGLYIIDRQKIPKFYYTTGDIRKLSN